MATPEEIKEHAHKFNDGAWRKYSYEELAQWVTLLTKRATHRSNFELADDDLDAAYNYMIMFKAKFEEESERIAKSFEGKDYEEKKNDGPTCACGRPDLYEVMKEDEKEK